MHTFLKGHFLSTYKEFSLFSVVPVKKSQRQIYWPDVEHKLWETLGTMATNSEITVLDQMKTFWVNPQYFGGNLDLTKNIMYLKLCKTGMSNLTPKLPF